MAVKDRLRRTMMFLPGNNPSMITDAHIYGPDSVMIDLEDATSVTQKDAARFLVSEALKAIDYKTTERVVRINGLDTPFGADDIRAVVKAGVDVIRLPKTDTPDDIIAVDKLITEVEKEIGREGQTLMMAAIESARGVLNAKEIALASPRMMGIALGAEDYVTNLKTSRSKHGWELYYARESIVLAARNAGIYCFDTVYSDVNNMEGFKQEVQFIKDLGFDGKSCIHPKQVRAVHEIYTPTQKEIEKALRVINGAKEAEAKGSGVISVDGKMVDAPIIARAYRVLELAKASGAYREVK
nr:citrate (pro-3S)-lyase subunit beta [uncultured Fusobacterium sp.]